MNNIFFGNEISRKLKIIKKYPELSIRKFGMFLKMSHFNKLGLLAFDALTALFKIQDEL
ncbi:MAG: hypothetical protein ACJAT4_000565 [Granulosicoccus sp.]|jgi:hypothetical protein